MMWLHWWEFFIWSGMMRNLRSLSLPSLSCVWYWSPCRSWCPDTRHTASARETASRPASSRNGKGWWHHQVGKTKYLEKRGTLIKRRKCLTHFLCSFSAAEPSRQAPNKRRKRKMSGGSTISGGGGTTNNNNNKKKSPGSGFPLSSQVPVSTRLLPSVCTLLLHLQWQI